MAVISLDRLSTRRWPSTSRAPSAPPPRRRLERGRERGARVGPPAPPPLAQHQPGPVRPGADQVQGRYAPGLVVRAPGRLAVHGHDPVLQRRGQRLHPCRKAGFQLGRIQQAEDAPEGVVRGNAVRQLQKGLQPGLLLVAKELDLGPVVGAADDGQGGDQEDGLQGMVLSLRPTGIVDRGEQGH